MTNDQTVSSEFILGVAQGARWPTDGMGFDPYNEIFSLGKRPTVEALKEVLISTKDWTDGFPEIKSEEQAAGFVRGASLAFDMENRVECKELGLTWAKTMAKKGDFRAIETIASLNDNVTAERFEQAIAEYGQYDPQYNGFFTSWNSGAQGFVQGVRDWFELATI